MRGRTGLTSRILLTISFCLAGFFAASVAAQTLSDNALSGMKWRSIGPFRGGRVLAVTGVVGDPNTYYFGAVAGGVWKTTNAGASWTPLTDSTTIRSIGAIEVAPSDPNVIYVGTGESCIRGDISYGDGVWKSTDAGKTWVHMGLDDTRHIAKVVINPHNPDIVFIAALGHAFGPNSDRGVYRSADGGKTWTKVLYHDEKTGAIDLVMDPANPRIMFAALWQAYRTPWSMNSGGPGSGIYKSTDGGLTWNHIEGHGLPSGVLGRIGVAVSGADDNQVWAIIEAERGGIYHSGDGGESWQLVNASHDYTQRAWYFHHIFADPKLPDTIYVLNTGVSRSSDGGRTFTGIRAPHGDNHGLWIDPTNSDYIINSNDGGATISHDFGKTWSTEDNQPTAEFYHVDTDTRFPYWVYGAQQDNSTVAIASRTGGGLITDQDWHAVAGGESGWVVPDPKNPDVTYAGSYDGLITRYDHKIGQAQDIDPWPLNPMGSGAADLKHRFQWTAPIAVSPNDPNVLYFGGEGVFESTNGGHSWTMLGGDLTRNDKSKQQSSGGPLEQDNTSVEYYDTVFCIAESPKAKGEIWAGTDDGYVQLTRDGGKTWSNVTPKGLPEWIKISIVDPSPHTDGTAYIAVDGQKLDDLRPYLYKTTDFGKTWTKITNGIPDGSFTHSIKEDSVGKGLLFAGTETGVFVSFDDGANWQSLRMNMPDTPVHDLVTKGNDLVVATHGRAFYILDDITPLREMTSATLGEDVHIYKPQVAYRMRGFGGFGGGRGGFIAAGANPPSGAMIDYYLKSAPQGPVSLEITDSKGTVVRRYSSRPPAGPAMSEEEQMIAAFFGGGGAARLPAAAGLNRFVWDLRYEAPHTVPGAVNWAGRGGAPVVPPGTYNLKFTINGQSYTSSVEVRKDPRIETTDADLEKQAQLALQVRDEVTKGNDAVNQIRSLRSQMRALEQRLEGDAAAKEITPASQALDKKMTAVEENLVQTKSQSGEDPLNFPIKVIDQMGGVGNTVGSADTAPTEQSYAVYDELAKAIDAQVAAWHEIEAKDLASLNEMIRKANIQTLAPSTAPPMGGRGGRRGG